MDCLKLDSRRYFLLGARLMFGAWFLYAGMVKWIMFGPTEFVGMIAGMFEATWSPHALNVVLGWIIIVSEPVLAALILWGKHARLVWTATAGLLFMLTMGQTILMSEQVIANWEYTVFALACAALSDPVEGEDETDED